MMHIFYWPIFHFTFSPAVSNLQLNLYIELFWITDIHFPIDIPFNIFFKDYSDISILSFILWNMFITFFF